MTLAGTGEVSLSSALNISGIPSHLFAANGEESGLPTYNGIGADYHSFGNITSDLYSGSVAKTSGLNPFIGTGLVSYDMTSIGTWVLTGGGDAQSTVANYLTAGTLKIDYEYDAIPEPATAALLVPMLGIIAWARRRFVD